MEKSYTSSLGTYVSSNRTKVIIIASFVGAGALLYLTKRLLCKICGQGQDELEKIDGVPMKLIKEELLRQKPNMTRGPIRHRKPIRIVGVKENDNSTYQKVGLAPSSTNIVSELVDLAVGTGNMENDALLQKAMSDLDSAINQLEEVMVTLNISKEPYLRNGIIKDITIQSEINKLRYLLDQTSSSEHQSFNLEGPTSSSLIDTKEEGSQDPLHFPEHSTQYRHLSHTEDTLGTLDTDSVSSDDSFVSAADSLGDTGLIEAFESLELQSELDLLITQLREKNSHLDLYMSALCYVSQQDVPVRSLRTAIVNCENDVDFCVKVHCLRQGFQELLKSETMRQWFVELGRTLLSTMLKKMDRDHKGFEKDFDNLVSYCECQENWVTIEKELRERRVCCMSFYDIILDFIIMDAFDDLENPPYTVTTAVQNRWLSDRIKETALTTAVWSVVKAKKQMLTNPNGFLGKMYDVSQHISPMLAWGFLGPVEDVRNICFSFRDAMVGFLRDIFSTSEASYTTVGRLADDIRRIAEHRRTEAERKLFTD